MNSTTMATSTATNDNSKRPTPSSPVTVPSGSPKRQCPYAVALSEDESSSTQSPLGGGKASFLTAELSQCPAFNRNVAVAGATAVDGKNNVASAKCPFQDAKSPEEVKQTLAQIPKSHYDAEHNSSFYQVLQHFHKVHEQGADTGFFDKVAITTQGQCPMKPYVSSTNTATAPSASRSFAQAMEDCSLAAIMARLAEDMEGDNKPKAAASAATMEEQEQAPQKEEPAAVLQKLGTPPNSMNNAKNHIPAHTLAEALKTGTAVSHQAAEDVHFVRNFIRGQIDRHLYQELILSLYHVYDKLEDALDKHAPSHFHSCHFPEALARKESLEDDVEFWHGTRTPAARTISPATQDYIDRIEELCNTDPLLLLAHSYTRYLGDLSGGRILARVARRALDLDKETGDGLAFYHFDKVTNYKTFKDEYRQALNALPLTLHQIQALVAEANVAFCLNMRLFQELDVMATIPGARVMTMEEVLEYAHIDSSSSQQPAAGEEQCPFLVNKKKDNNNTATTTKTATKGGRCPWPFVFAHDPVQGMKDWQTWLLVALIVAWCRHSFA